jgi:hypothetical protein
MYYCQFPLFTLYILYIKYKNRTKPAKRVMLQILIISLSLGSNYLFNFHENIFVKIFIWTFIVIVIIIIILAIKYKSELDILYKDENRKYVMKNVAKKYINKVYKWEDMDAYTWTNTMFEKEIKYINQFIGVLVTILFSLSLLIFLPHYIEKFLILILSSCSILYYTQNRNIYKDLVNRLIKKEPWYFQLKCDILTEIYNEIKKK